MVILQKERSENSRSYAVRVLLYNIIHLELQPEPLSVKMSFPPHCPCQGHRSAKL